VTEVPYFEEPVVMCEEGRPKVAGDACGSDDDCQPPSSSGPRTTVDRMHLACDEATLTCVPVPDPFPADWNGACGEDPAAYLDPGEPGWSSGFIRDPACAGGICLFQESETCIASQCGLECEHDWDCPDASWCYERHDWTRLDGGVVGYSRVCVPTVPEDCR
jgi:hypothetical protein